MDNKINKFSCAPCNYKTNDKSNFFRHNHSPKHLCNINKTTEKPEPKHEGQPEGQPELKQEGQPEGQPELKQEGQPEEQPEGQPDIYTILDRLDRLEHQNKALQEENTLLKAENKERQEDILETQENIDYLLNRYASICIMLQDMRDSKSLIVWNITEHDKEQDVTEKYNNKLIKYMQDRAKQRKKENILLQ